MFSVFLFLLAGPVVAHPPLLSSRQGGFQGIATFNNYGAQGGTTCGPASGNIVVILLAEIKYSKLGELMLLCKQVKVVLTEQLRLTSLRTFLAANVEAR